jgi:hypothetical protein
VITYTISDSRTGQSQSFTHLHTVPMQHLWAFNHILTVGCGSISVGSTIYSVITKS